MSYFPIRKIYAMIALPSRSVLAVGEHLYNGTFVSCESSDAGRTWREVGAVPILNSERRVFGCFSHGQVHIFVNRALSPLRCRHLVSADRGASWEESKMSGVPDTLSHFSVCIDGSGALYCIGGALGDGENSFASPVSTVYKSVNGGFTWVPVSSGIAPMHSASSVCTPQGHILVAGGMVGTRVIQDSFISVDGGVSWNNTSLNWSHADLQSDTPVAEARPKAMVLPYFAHFEKPHSAHLASIGDCLLFIDVCSGGMTRMRGGVHSVVGIAPESYKSDIISHCVIGSEVLFGSGRVVWKMNEDLNGWVDLPSDPMHEAALREDVAAVRRLIDQGRDVSVSSRLGITPLSIAISKNKPDLVKQLLKEGADPNFTPNIDLSTVDEEMEAVMKRIDTKYLEEVQRYYNRRHTDSYTSSALRLVKNIEILLPMIEYGMCIRDYANKGLIRIAYATMSWEMIAFLVLIGLDIRKKDRDGVSPLEELERAATEAASRAPKAGETQEDRLERISLARRTAAERDKLLSLPRDRMFTWEDTAESLRRIVDLALSSNFYFHGTIQFRKNMLESDYARAAVTFAFQRQDPGAAMALVELERRWRTGGADHVRDARKRSETHQALFPHKWRVRAWRAAACANARDTLQSILEWAARNGDKDLWPTEMPPVPVDEYALHQMFLEKMKTLVQSKARDQDRSAHAAGHSSRPRKSVSASSRTPRPLPAGRGSVSSRKPAAGSLSHMSAAASAAAAAASAADDESDPVTVSSSDDDVVFVSSAPK
jgi:hypothetical protein